MPKKQVSRITKVAQSIPESNSEADIQNIILDDLKKQEAALIKVKEAQQAWGIEAGESLANAILGAKDFEGALQNIASTIIQDLLPEMGKMLFDSEGSFEGAGLGGALATGIGDLFGFGGAKAAGGFTKFGKAYQVGESGPEMFIPQTDGIILPHHIMRSMNNMQHQTQQQQSNFNVTMHVQANDAGSFKKSQAQIVGDLNRQMNAMSRRVI